MTVFDCSKNCHYETAMVFIAVNNRHYETVMSLKELLVKKFESIMMWRSALLMGPAITINRPAKNRHTRYFRRSIRAYMSRKNGTRGLFVFTIGVSQKITILEKNSAIYSNI